MRSSKLALLLALLGALALAACAPGGSNTGALPNVKPTRLQIKVYEVTSPTPKTVLVENAATVQNIYNSAAALPAASQSQACPAIGGPRYELTFLEGEKVVVTAVADRGGCASVIFGANDVRQPNEAFWQLLNQAIAEATPPARPDRAEGMTFTGPQHPPLLSTIASAEQARQLYDAIRALPEDTNTSGCPEATGTHYTLIFFEGTTRYQAEVDKNGCISGPTSLAEQHQADQAFWQLLNQTLASAPTTPAQPDTLEMKTVPASNDPSTTASAVTITNQDTIQKIYKAIYALPEQPGGQACPAIVGTVYGLTFVKDNVVLLTAIADKSGCGTVTNEGYVRLANQAFWDLLRQAQTA
jgi:hypothetical protein